MSGPAPRGWTPRTPPPDGRAAVPPGPGQESAWDYPRPPAVVPTEEHVVVRLGRTVVADTRRALRVLETSHPPTYYVPRDDVLPGALRPAPGSSWCEFKGAAAYLDVVVVVAGEPRVEHRAAWTYPDPTPPYAALVGHVAFYPARMTLCTVEGEPVAPQDGSFYGGWVTSRVVGPFKGAPGSARW